MIYLKSIVNKYSHMDVNELNHAVKPELTEIVKEMRSANKGKQICIDEDDILAKCVYCKYFLSSNEYGPLIEKYIKTELKMTKCDNNTSGDGKLGDKNIEIKVSLGDKSGQLNVVQIRPDHTIDYYIFIAYNLYENECGKIYHFIIPSEKMYALVKKYGSYAHGTIAKLGKISESNFYGKNYEYALRPKPNGTFLKKVCQNDNIHQPNAALRPGLGDGKDTNKQKKIWDELLQFNVCNFECAKYIIDPQ